MSIFLLEWGYLDHARAGTGLAAGHCNQCRPQAVIVPGLARLIKQNGETRTGGQQNGTGAQRPCPSPCMPGRISLCSSMPVREGHPSTGGARCASGPDTQTDRSVSVNNYLLLPLAARRAKAAGTAHPGLRFLRSRGGRAPKGGQAESFSSTIFFILGRFFLWLGWRYATG